MNPRGEAQSPFLSSGYAGVAIEPPESGDLQVLVPLPAGVLIAVIDGLGHGPEAALAARVAKSTLEAQPSQPIKDLVSSCHEALRGTRGVVMSVVVLDVRSSTLTWLGVGNVEGVLLRAAGSARSDYEAICASGGVLGFRLPALRSATLEVTPGDTLILATDGIRRGFLERIELEQDPQEMAEAILARDALGSDDALVFCARYLGGGP